jgi:CubicO group peptidase (beta-lactamase class C family)
MPLRVALGRAIVLAIIASAVVAGSAAAQSHRDETRGAGPRYRADGPDADAYGRKEGYPACSGLTYRRDLGCRVGALSQFDTLFPARVIAASKSPTPLRRAAAEPSIRYSFNGEARTLERYLDTNPVTGFLIAKGDTILVERYQYGRTDKQRLASFSMAKTVIGLLIGLAIEDGSIRSIDDPAEAYVPGLKGTEYGRTPIKALLQMSSGIAFDENYENLDSDAGTLVRLTLGQDPGGSLAAVKRFKTRYAEPGQRFSYSSAESLVLGLVLTGATRRTVAEYASEKLWVPLGAEADASWSVDATGQEITFAFMNAVLRDWARLGLMLAHDGTWQGRSVVPRPWLLASTTIGPGSPFWSTSLKPGAHAPGYGFQIWLLPAKQRMLALRGYRGQFVLVDPATKLVLVQTAIQDGSYNELFVLWSALVSQLQ